jgi:hypothetical protein
MCPNLLTTIKNIANLQKQLEHVENYEYGENQQKELDAEAEDGQEHNFFAESQQCQLDLEAEIEEVKQRIRKQGGKI